MNLHAVYHVAPIGHWKIVFIEQLYNLLKRSGATLQTVTITTYLVGDSVQWIKSVCDAANYPVKIDVMVSGLDMRMGETPAFLFMQDLAKKYPNEAVLYFHTKGVSHQRSAQHVANSNQWRWVMCENTVLAVATILEKLAEGYLAGGWNWQYTSPYFPFYPGNFWLAQTNHIANLEDFSRFQADYRSGIADIYSHYHPRYACEHWIAGRQFNRYEIPFYSQPVTDLNLHEYYRGISPRDTKYQYEKKLFEKIKVILQKPSSLHLEFIRQFFAQSHGQS